MVSVRCFGVRVSVMFHFIFVYYTFSSVWVAEWPPFGKQLPVRLIICSHYILSIFNIYLFPALVLRAGFLILIGPVPVHCFSITFCYGLLVIWLFLFEGCPLAVRMHYFCPLTILTSRVAFPTRHEGFCISMEPAICKKMIDCVTHCYVVSNKQ